MNEIYCVEDLIEVLGDDADLLVLTPKKEKECLIGYSERCNDDRLPVYNLDKILEVSQSLSDNRNIYYLSAEIKYKDIPTENYVFPEFKDAFMGMVEKKDGIRIVAYDTLKCLDKLERDMKPIETDDMSAYSLAIEHFYYNVVGSWIGETTPVFITRIITEEASLKS
jgi:hypothetical protein